MGLVLTSLSRRPPDVARILDTAEQLVSLGHYEQAKLILRQVQPLVDSSLPVHQAHLHLIWGDLVFLEQKTHGWDNPDNHWQVVNRYQQAERLGWPLDAVHLQRWAETLVALDRYDQALEILDRIQEPSPQRRCQVIRQMIDRRLAQGAVDPTSIEPLIDRFVREVGTDSDRPAQRQQLIWATMVRAQLRLDSGQAESLIDPLQRQILRFMDQGGDEDLGPLLVLLGRAYHQVGDTHRAQTYYRLAQQRLRPEDPASADAMARVLVGLGQIALTQPEQVGEPEAARLALEYFTKAETEYRATGTYLDALLGRAVCEARLGMNVEALEHFSQAVFRLVGTRNLNSPRVQRLVELIAQQHAIHFDRGDYSLALEYLTLLDPLFRDQWPADLLLALARTYEARAQQNLAQSRQLAEQIEKTLAAAAVSESVQPLSLQALPDQGVLTALRRQIALDFDKAGQLYLQHADRVTVNQPEDYGQSLWQAALCFELAQNWKEAIEVLTRFVRTLPGDSRHLEAVHRLALAYSAGGQFEAAAELLRWLIDEHPQSPFALASYVPLARCCQALGKPDLARQLLERVLNNHPAIGPQSAEYRQALVELGQLLYQQREFEAAIPHLHEAVERTPDSLERAGLCFLLADAYRQSVRSLEEDLKLRIPLSRRQALLAERTRRLEQARSYYAQVIRLLGVRPDELLPELERLYLRNAYLYRADCAYALGWYEQAIHDYDQAARRYDGHPVSLMALVQIVNAYSQMGRIQEARAANDRARAQLKRIPPQAFDDPGLPMNRQQWEEWLRFSTQFQLFQARLNPTDLVSSPTPAASP